MHLHSKTITSVQTSSTSVYPRPEGISDDQSAHISKKAAWVLKLVMKDMQECQDSDNGPKDEFSQTAGRFKDGSQEMTFSPGAVVLQPEADPASFKCEGVKDFRGKSVVSAFDYPTEWRNSEYHVRENDGAKEHVFTENRHCMGSESYSVIVNCEKGTMQYEERTERSHVEEGLIAGVKGWFGGGL